MQKNELAIKKKLKKLLKQQSKIKQEPAGLIN